MADNKDGAGSIKVAVRVRPLNSRERDLQDTVACTVDADGVVEVRVKCDQEPRIFAFDYGYGMASDQEGVHADLGCSLLENVAGGYNSCLFAYGQTGAGKSWSILGNQKCNKNRGLLPRICESLFNSLHDDQSLRESHVVCTYLEIYNEKIRDLLTPGSNSSLDVRKHPTQGVFVPNLTEMVAQSYDDVARLIEFGDTTRSVAATAMNATSSRSHAVFTVKVAQIWEGKTQKAQMHIVDLAGSERQTKTGAEGSRLREGAAINQSLTVLGQVIFALASEKEKSNRGALHVPFRNSKLTFLLSDSLSGNSKTVMIAAVSPAANNYEETLNTLRFAQSVKKVKTRAVKNESLAQNKDAQIQELMQQVEELKARLRSSEQPNGDTPCLVLRKQTVDDVSDLITAPDLMAAPDLLALGTNEAEDVEPSEQQHLFTQELEVIERCVALTGTEEQREAMRNLSDRFVRLRAKVEHMNYIMSWMMEWGYMPTSDGFSAWVATLAWETSVENSPHLQGDIRAQLHVHNDAGLVVLQNYDEDEFEKVFWKLDEKFEECQKMLNKAPQNDRWQASPTSAKAHPEPEVSQPKANGETRKANTPSNAQAPPETSGSPTRRDHPNHARPALKEGKLNGTDPRDALQLDGLRAENDRQRAEIEELKRQLEACQPQNGGYPPSEATRESKEPRKTAQLTVPDPQSSLKARITSTSPSRPAMLTTPRGRGLLVRFQPVGQSGTDRLSSPCAAAKSPRSTAKQ